VLDHTSDTGSGGGGGGGNAFADVGGKGTIDSLNLVVTNNSDNIHTVGSLRYEIAHASAGDSITFDPSVTLIQLSSSLVIARNVTIEGAQPGATIPGVLIAGNSSFTDIAINAGVTASIDGLTIVDGHGAGASGAYGASGGGTGGRGQGAGGGIYDAGTLTLTDSDFANNTATGGAGGHGGLYNGGGGAGGNAAGGIYVASTGTLNYTTGDHFSNNSAAGGAGGRGASTNYGAYSNIAGDGYGGAGGYDNTAKHPTGGGVAGKAGHAGSNGYAPAGLWGAGGAPDQPGGYGHAGGGGGGGTAFANFGGAGTINLTPCYCPGTLIKTPHGEARVETLEIGDEVMTASGVARPIKWIGRRSYAGRFVMGRKDILPICIKAGALDENVPKRDLWVSPHHAMYLEGVLIEAKDLVNGVSIVQAEQVEKVEYFHIEFDTHDVIIAEGALAESFIDDDSRGMFHNAHEYETLYAGDAAPAVAHYCAPRLNEGYQVEEARRRIAARAGLVQVAKGEQLGPLRGYVDEVSTTRIAGWAQNPDHPDAPVCLDIFADGQMIGQVLANTYRTDLWRAGIGSGYHAFTFVPPQGIALASVELRRSLDGALLARGPSVGTFAKVHRRARRA
jgi:hypothetical protein